MSSGVRILVVDDEPEVCRLIQRHLGREGYEVRVAGSGAAMRQALTEASVDLIVLDLRLPDDDGLSLARELRQRTPGIGIIMLTSKADLVDRVVGLESGADDYIPKPFEPRELEARMRAVLRRTRAESLAAPTTARNSAEFPGWRLDLDTHQLFSDDNGEVHLKPAEFELLAAFVQHPNRVLSRDFLLDLTRGRTATPYDRSIDVHVGQLRKKIELDPTSPTLIRTVRGAGYIFTPSVRRQ